MPNKVSNLMGPLHIFFVPGGGLGDANQVLDGGGPRGRRGDEDGFAVEEAGGPVGLEGLGGDFDVGEGVGGGTDAASLYKPTMIGSTS